MCECNFKYGTLQFSLFVRKNFHYLYETKRISIMISEMTFENVDRHTDKGQTKDVCNLLTFKPSHGLHRRAISVVNFFRILRLLFFALLLLYVN